MVHWSERLLFCVSLAALTFYGCMLGYTKALQTYDSWAFDRHLQGEPAGIQDFLRFLLRRPAPPGQSPSGGPVAETKASDRPRVIGRLEIPAIRLSTMILSGTDEWTLARAAGHIQGTAFPWESGNFAIAAHRDGLFRPLRGISPGDSIRVTTARGTYDYRVDDKLIVKPAETHVLQASPHSSLTLVTCFPFVYVGDAPDRFVVRAHRVEPGSSLPTETKVRAQAGNGPGKGVVRRRGISNKREPDVQVASLSFSHVEPPEARRGPHFFKRFGKALVKPITALAGRSRQKRDQPATVEAAAVEP